MKWIPASLLKKKKLCGGVGTRGGGGVGGVEERGVVGNAERKRRQGSELKIIIIK